MANSDFPLDLIQAARWARNQGLTREQFIEAAGSFWDSTTKFDDELARVRAHDKET